jgi:hypothetical protein
MMATATGFCGFYFLGDQSSWSSWVFFLAHAGKRRQGMDFLCPRIISLHIICTPPTRKSMWVPWPHEVWHWIRCNWVHLSLDETVKLSSSFVGFFKCLQGSEAEQSATRTLVNGDKLAAVWLKRIQLSASSHLVTIWTCCISACLWVFEEGAGSSLHLSSSHC